MFAFRKTFNRTYLAMYVNDSETKLLTKVGKGSWLVMENQNKSEGNAKWHLHRKTIIVL